MDRLYQVGVAIRKSSTVTLSSRIQAFSATHDDEDYFFSLAVEIVKWRFPDADAAICSHLAATIKFRRQKIRYQRRHQSKLRCGARRAAEQPSLSPAAPLLFGTPRIDAKRQEELAGINTVVQAPSQTSASTFLARDFLRHLNAPPSAPSDTQGTEPLSAPSMMSSGSTVIEYGNLSFPQPPAVQEGMSASCVWCFQEHMSEQYNDTRWWRYVELRWDHAVLELGSQTCFFQAPCPVLSPAIRLSLRGVQGTTEAVQQRSRLAKPHD